MTRFLVYISILLSFVFQTKAEVLVDSLDRSEKYNFELSTEKGYLSGILILSQEGDVINGCMFNEFGVTAMGFTYDISKDKLKLLHVIKFLDKWYIKRVISKDIKACIKTLWGMPLKPEKNMEVSVSPNETVVYNKKRKIRYIYSPMQESNDTKE